MFKYFMCIYVCKDCLWFCNILFIDLAYTTSVSFNKQLIYSHNTHDVHENTDPNKRTHMYTTSEASTDLGIYVGI